MLQNLLKNPGVTDGAALEALLANPELSRLPGSAGPLAAHDPAGHLNGTHIGKTDAELTARLGAEPGIPAASTFNSAAEAEAAVAATLRQTAAQFWEWLAAGATGKLELTGSFSGGSVMLRGATASTPGSGITLILKGSGGGNWFILTGFPIP